MASVDLQEITVAGGVTIRVLFVAETDRAVLAALASLWHAISEQNDRIPDPVIFDLQPRHPSTCSSVEWDTAPIIVLNLKDASGRTLPARDILDTLLHLAAHAASRASSRASESRYHSAEFAEAARTIGLNVSGDRVPGIGYRPEGFVRGTLTRYQEQTRELTKALKDWHPEVIRKRDRSAILLTCKCDPPRKIRVSPGVAALGPVTCGVCGELFTPASASS